MSAWRRLVRWVRWLLVPEAPPPPPPLDASAGDWLRDAARRRAALERAERRAAEQARRLEELEDRLRLHTRRREEGD